MFNHIGNHGNHNPTPPAPTERTHQTPTPTQATAGLVRMGSNVSNQSPRVTTHSSPAQMRATNELNRLSLVHHVPTEATLPGSDRLPPHHGHGAAAPTPLIEAVSYWLGAETAAQWRGFNTEDPSGTFTSFLRQLQNAASLRGPGVRAHLRVIIPKLLNRMADCSPTLWSDCFAVARTAAVHHEDITPMILCGMESAMLAEEVRRGDFDFDLPRLISTIRQLYRRESLAKIALAKSTSLGTADPVEVFVAYQAHLNTALDLGLQIPSSHASSMAGLTATDLREAITQVRAEESTGFLSHLINDCRPWEHAFVQLESQDAYSAMREASINLEEQLPHLYSFLWNQGVQDPDRLLGLPI